MPTKQPRRMYQLKVTLAGSKPPIWRRILVAEDISLGALHTVLQIVMGWENCHLHHFSFRGEYYGSNDNHFGNDFDSDYHNEHECRLHQLLTSEKETLHYEYDFGDSWEHKIVLEKILPDDGLSLPRCIKGKRACPPEDCGGIWSYLEMLDIQQQPEHPRYAELMEWFNGPIDPEQCDLAAINDALAKQFKTRHR